MAKKQSLISEDDDTFHVHDGKGHFLVAKKGIGKDTHERIRSLPKYYAGGDVLGSGTDSAVKKEAPLPDWLTKPGYEEIKDAFAETNKPKVPRERVEQAMANPEDPFAKNYPGELKQAAQFYGLAPTESPKPASVTQPVADPAQAVEKAIVETPAPQQIAQQMQSQQDAMGLMPVLKNLQDGAQLQAAGIQAEANAISDLSREQNTMLGQMYSPEKLKAEEARLADLESKRLKLEAENDELFKAATNNKIDPRRVWNNMSSGNKVMATIAIILGGMGSGGDAANNAAMKVINKAIDDDINAQKEEKENARSLYQLNFQRYRDTQSAMDATRLQMNAIAQGQLNALASKYAAPAAQAKAKILMGTLKQQQAELTAGVIAKSQKAVQDRNENLIPGYGVAQVKPSEEDKNVLASAGIIKKGLQNLQNRAIQKGTTISGSSTDAENKALIAGMKLQLKTLFKLGQISESDSALMDPLATDPGAWRTDKAVRQLEQAKRVVESVEDATLGKLGLSRQQAAQQKPRISFEEYKKRSAEGTL